MKSTCTDRPARRTMRPRRHAGPLRQSAAGTALIELLLVILLVFLPLLALTVGAFTLGIGRLRNVASAEDAAYSQVIAGRNVTASADAPPTLPAIPSLHTRYDESIAAGAVRFTRQPFLPSQLNNVTLSDKARFLAPAWHFASYPDSTMDDRLDVENWFRLYSQQSPRSAVAGSLELQPAWTP